MIYGLVCLLDANYDVHRKDQDVVHFTLSLKGDSVLVSVAVHEANKILWFDSQSFVLAVCFSRRRGWIGVHCLKSQFTRLCLNSHTKIIKNRKKKKNSLSEKQNCKLRIFRWIVIWRMEVKIQLSYFFVFPGKAKRVLLIPCHLKPTFLPCCL